MMARRGVIGLLGWNLGKFSKVLRVQHVSEVPETRVGMRPGDGSAEVACRKMPEPMERAA